MGSISCRGCLHDLIGINTSMGYIHVCNGINSVYEIATHKNKNITLWHIQRAIISLGMNFAYKRDNN